MKYRRYAGLYGRAAPWYVELQTCAYRDNDLEIQIEIEIEMMTLAEHGEVMRRRRINHCDTLQPQKHSRTRTLLTHFYY